MIEKSNAVTRTPRRQRLKPRISGAITSDSETASESCGRRASELLINKSILCESINRSFGFQVKAARISARQESLGLGWLAGHCDRRGGSSGPVLRASSESPGRPATPRQGPEARRAAAAAAAVSAAPQAATTVAITLLPPSAARTVTRRPGPPRQGEPSSAATENAGARAPAAAAPGARRQGPAGPDPNLPGLRRRMIENQMP